MEQKPWKIKLKKISQKVEQINRGGSYESDKVNIPLIRITEKEQKQRGGNKEIMEKN